MIKTQEEIIQDYFNRESSDYLAYYDKKSRQKSFVRNVSRALFQKAIVGRLEAVVELCPEPFNTLKVCEVGCGGGHYSIALAKKGAQVMGLDYAEKMIESARGLAAKQGAGDKCHFLATDVFEFKPVEKFDVVFAAGVIDYVPAARHHDLLKKMISLSSKYIVVSFPKKFHYHAFFRKIWLTYKGIPVTFFTDREMTEALEAAGAIPDKTIDVGILKVIRARVP